MDFKVIPNPIQHLPMSPRGFMAWLCPAGMGGFLTNPAKVEAGGANVSIPCWNSKTCWWHLQGVMVGMWRGGRWPRGEQGWDSPRAVPALQGDPFSIACPFAEQLCNELLARNPWWDLGIWHPVQPPGGSAGTAGTGGTAGTAGCAPSLPAKLSQSQPGSAAAQSCVFNSPRDIPVPSRLQGAVKVAGLLRCHHPPSLHHLCHPMPPDWNGTDENRRERRVCFCSQILSKNRIEL